jgi:hypothetical protein
MNLTHSTHDSPASDPEDHHEPQLPLEDGSTDVYVSPIQSSSSSDDENEADAARSPTTRSQVKVSSSFDQEFDAAVKRASRQLYLSKHRPRHPRKPSANEDLYHSNPTHRAERESHVKQRIKKDFPPYGLFQGIIQKLILQSSLRYVPNCV